MDFNKLSLGSAWQSVSTIWKRLGLRGALAYILCERLYTLRMLPRKEILSPDKQLCHLFVKNVPFPLLCRRGTSDRWAFGQIFVRQEYTALSVRRQPKLIIDCGANVGYTSVYFLNKYPSAHIIAIEPDIDNFELLVKNLSPYGERAQAIHAAIWPEPTDLVVCRAPEGSREEWGTWVRPSQVDEAADIRGIDIPFILTESGFGHIDVLKIDIEGAEAALFAHQSQEWIHKVNAFFIELHNPECERAFRQALSGHDFIFSQRGEITVAVKTEDRKQ